MSRARDNANLGAQAGSGLDASDITTGVLPVGVTGGSGLNALSASNLSAGVVPDARMPNLTGAITTVEGAVATTIANDAVGTDELANNVVISTSGTATFSGANAVVLSTVTDDAATPTLAFGDGDTGFYESADDTLQITIGGTAEYQIDDYDIRSKSSGAFMLDKIASSSSNPTYAWNGDTNSGLGHTDPDIIHLITNGSPRLTIDSSGSITTPTQPAFLASLSTFTSDRVNTYKQYTGFTEVLDRRNNFDNGTDLWRFTAPVAGYYLMGVTLEINSGSIFDTTSWNYPCMMKKNNTTFMTTIDDYMPEDDKHMVHSYTIILSLAVDDYITWWSHDAGNKLVVSGGANGRNSYVWGHLLG